MDTTTPRKQVTGVASGWNVLLGIWLIASPFILGFTQNTVFMWNNIILGIVIGILALIRSAGGDSKGVGSWLNVLLGIWVIISPFVLGFSNQPAPLWNNIILGVVVAIVAWASASSAHVTVAPTQRQDNP